MPCITAICCTAVSQAFWETETILHGHVRTHVYMTLIPKGLLCTCNC